MPMVRIERKVARPSRISREILMPSRAASAALPASGIPARTTAATTMRRRLTKRRSRGATGWGLGGDSGPSVTTLRSATAREPTQCCSGEHGDQRDDDEHQNVGPSVREVGPAVKLLAGDGWLRRASPAGILRECDPGGREHESGGAYSTDEAPNNASDLHVSPRYRLSRHTVAERRRGVYPADAKMICFNFRRASYARRLTLLGPFALDSAERYKPTLTVAGRFALHHFE